MDQVTSSDLSRRVEAPDSRDAQDGLAPFSRSLSTRFLFRVVPTMLISFVLVIGGYQAFLYHTTYERLARKLQLGTASTALILGDAVAERDLDKIGLIIAAEISDPDVIGIAVYDANNRPLDTYGSGFDHQGPLVSRTTIIHVDLNGNRQVGWLSVALTDARIMEAMVQSVTYQLAIALILLAIAVVGSMVAFRRTIGVPLAHLMAAIRDAESGRLIRTIEWSSDDELGRVIRAYNDMQSRRLAIEQDLSTAKELAEIASRSKSEFLANMSHELRTPLNSIIGFSDVIREEILGPNGNPRYRAYADSIHQSGSHLLSIIDDILDISRIEAGRVSVDEEPVDLHGLYQSCLVIVGHRAAQRQVKLIDQTRSQLPDLLADRRQVKQVLINLLTNAIKFTDPGGTVTTSVRIDPDGGIELLVADTGIGIAAEDQQAVFEPFTQVASSQARSHEGTGLGLAICRSLVALHGGSISLESAIAVGTTVTVRFPSYRTLVSEQTNSAVSGC